MLSIDAVEKVLNKRSIRGASDESLIRWLEHLKKGPWKYHQTVINGFIDAIKQTPLNGGQ